MVKVKKYHIKTSYGVVILEEKKKIKILENLLKLCNKSRTELFLENERLKKKLKEVV